jgi:hypothetical protein
MPRVRALITQTMPLLDGQPSPGTSLEMLDGKDLK